MKKFMGLISKVVVATVVLGIVTGCNRVPFLGRNQSANQAGDSTEATQNQPGTRTQVQRAPQPGTRNQNSNLKSAQAPNATSNPADTNADGTQSDGNQGVSALW